MACRDCTIIVPEEIFSAAPNLDFGSCRVIRRPREGGIGSPGREAIDVQGMITLLTDPVTGSLLDRFPKLRIVANCSVGIDNVDLKEADRRGIWITHTPGVLTDATADLTWALILAVTRRLREGREQIIKKAFTGWRFDSLLGMELRDRILGIIGPGRIGTAVALRGRAFGMRIRYFGRKRNGVFEKDTGGDYLPLDLLLSTAHIVSLHVPLDPSTEHLIGAGELASMRDDAVLINTSRGRVIDERALVDTLNAGRLLGAGLDVFEREPFVPEDLLNHPRVVVTPHIGSATGKTRGRMARIAHENLMAVMRGNHPPNPVNRPREVAGNHP